MKPLLSVMATISSIFSRQYASKFCKRYVQDSKSLLAALFFHHSYQSVLYVLSYKKKKLWQSLLTLFFFSVHETIYKVVMVKRMNIHAAGSIIVNNTLLISQLQGNKRKKEKRKETYTSDIIELNELLAMWLGGWLAFSQIFM